MSIESDRIDDYIDMHEEERIYDRNESQREYWEKVLRDAEKAVETALRMLGRKAIEQVGNNNKEQQ